MHGSARNVRLDQHRRFGCISGDRGNATVLTKRLQWRGYDTTLTVVEPGDPLPDSGQVYQVETGWRLVDGEWMLLNASWTPNL